MLQQLKWTVNGELRIGFFARRSISKDEELTFDYQFQTFGEKQQKCYCGSEKCRGYLGMSNSTTSNNNLDHIWDETDSEEDEDDDDDDNDESPIKNNNKSYEHLDDLDVRILYFNCYFSI